MGAVREPLCEVILSLGGPLDGLCEVILSLGGPLDMSLRGPSKPNTFKNS